MFKSVYSAGQVSEQQAHEALKAKIWDDGVALRFFRLQKMSEGSIDLLEGEADPLKGPTDVGTARAKDAIMFSGASFCWSWPLVSQR